MAKVAINGFGRIGRSVLKALLKNHPEMKVVAVNDLASKKSLAHLLRHDSVYGGFEGEIEVEDEFFKVNGERIRIFSKKDPAELPWQELEIDTVLECTGVFTHEEGARKHLDAGAKRVVISANSKTADLPHFVMGVNHEDYDPEKHKVASTCSCTTNCATPVVKVINEEFGLIRSHMLTVHAVTASQNLVDGPHKDLRRARTAFLNTIPTTTGSDKAVVRVLPELEGKLSATAMRVPVSCGSILEVVAELEKEVESSEVNEVLKNAAKKFPEGTLSFSEEPLVSSDIIGREEASIIDGLSTEILRSEGKGSLVKILSWYDNEYGYAARMAEFMAFIS